MPKWTWTLRRSTLHLLTGGGVHLHVVMNDPVFDPVRGVDSVLLVNLCSAKPGIVFDETCILHAGCHPFIKHDTYVDYYHAVVKAALPLEGEVAAGSVRTDQPMQEEDFKRIRDGFTVTRDLSQSGSIMRFFNQNGI